MLLSIFPWLDSFPDGKVSSSDGNKFQNFALAKSFPLESRPLLLRRLCEHYTIWFPSFSHQDHEGIYLGSSSWEYKDLIISSCVCMCVCVCVCVCVVTYQEVILSHYVSCNSTRFWHCLSGDSIRCHRIRVHFHRYASPPHYRHQLKVLFVTCASDQLAIDHGFQWPSFWIWLAWGAHKNSGRYFTN